MRKPDKNEQWLLDGVCKACRRNNYCSKPCTAHKRAVKARMGRMARQAMDETTGGVMSAVIEKAIGSL